MLWCLLLNLVCGFGVVVILCSSFICLLTIITLHGGVCVWLVVYRSLCLYFGSLKCPFVDGLVL